jgi:uncharacterized membrane protein YjjP (DUF1212 family)|tara:strand:+ start:8950 stop:9174 length:225 start_codon:yes stop_codon:yes gene_type:complete
MTVLDFYTLDLTTLVIILLITLAVFMLLNYIDEERDDNFMFNITASIVSGIIVSVLYSYITIEPDEILTTNYWD